jgi:hypothetical protein
LEREELETRTELLHKAAKAMIPYSAPLHPLAVAVADIQPGQQMLRKMAQMAVPAVAAAELTETAQLEELEIPLQYRRRKGQMADREVPLQITVLEAAAERQHPVETETLQHRAMAAQEQRQHCLEAALRMPAAVAAVERQLHTPSQPEQAGLVAAETVGRLPL